MALITEELIKAISNKIEDAEITLKTFFEEYKASSESHKVKKEEIKQRSEHHDAVLRKQLEDGNTLTKSYDALWREFFVLNSQKAEIINGKRFNNKEAWEAFLGDGMQQAMQPYDMDDQTWNIYMKEWREENEPKFESYREKHEQDWKDAMDKATDEVAEKEDSIRQFFAEQSSKYEKLLSEAESDHAEAEANYKEKNEKLLNLNQEIADIEKELAAVTAKHADAKTKYDSMPDGPDKDDLGKELSVMQADIDSLNKDIKDSKEERDKNVLPDHAEATKIFAEAEKAREAAVEIYNHHRDAKEFIENEMEWAREEHNDLGQDNRNVMISSGIYEITLKPLNDYIEEGRSNNLVRKRAEEEEARKNIAEASIKDKRREKIILEFKADNEQEHKEFRDDTDIMKTLLKEELNISEESESKIQAIIREHEGEEGDFNAGKALELTRASLFDLNKSGVIDKIKSACSKGLTTVSFDTEEISGTEILGLIWKGYKITHNSKPLAGPNRQLTRISTKIIVEWGIINES